MNRLQRMEYELEQLKKNISLMVDPPECLPTIERRHVRDIGGEERWNHLLRLACKAMELEEDIQYHYKLINKGV